MDLRAHFPESGKACCPGPASKTSVISTLTLKLLHSWVQSRNAIGYSQGEVGDSITYSMMGQKEGKM